MKKKLDPKAVIRELEAMPKLVRGPSRPLAPPLTEIREAFFPSRSGGHNAYVSNPVDVRALSNDERRILELLCELDPEGASYPNAGLPHSIRTRRRLIGLDAPSVIDEHWRALQAALDEYGRKFANRTKPGPPIQAWIAEKYFDVSPEEWLEIWTEVAACAYGNMATWDRPLPHAAAAVSPKARRAWAEKWAKEIMTSLAVGLRDSVAPHIEDAFRAANETLPASFVAMTKVKRAHEKREKPKPAPKRKPLGKWTFRGKNMDLRDIVRSSLAKKRQFLVAAKKYAGETFKTPKAFAAWETKQLDGDVIDLRFYTIALGKKPVYEMWTFLVDNGTVFPIGSHVPSGVHMIQGDFHVEDKRPESKELAEELQRDVPF